MRGLVFAAALCVAQPVSALTCMQGDIARDWQTASDASEDYRVVIGRLTFDASLLPEMSNDAPQETLIPAQIDGRSLTTSGFDAPYARDVTLTVRCFGPWCGATTSGVQHLMFVKETSAGAEVELTPCPGMIYAEPSQALADQVLTCAQEGCTPGQPQRGGPAPGALK